ncbi:hypothetical protein ACHWQZ_G008758 [Mnemiopsis leidyi]
MLFDNNRKSGLNIMVKSSLILLLVLMAGVEAVSESVTMPQSTQTTSTSSISTETGAVTIEPLTTDLLKKLLDINDRMKNKIGRLYDPGTDEDEKELRKELWKINGLLEYNEYSLKALLGELNVSKRQKSRMPEMMIMKIGTVISKVEALKRSNTEDNDVVETVDFLLADQQIPEFQNILKKILDNKE